MTKDRLISALLNFAPQIVGVCPKCGDPIFKGYLCFRCGFDASEVRLKPIEWDKLK